MKVNEIFTSIQGEGRLIGTPAHFVRFFGCNLNCSWCDTKSAVLEEGNYEVLEPLSIAYKIANGYANMVVLTGGEPFFQDYDKLYNLLFLLRSIRRRFVQIETNGTLVPEINLLHLVNHVTISPKLSSSGNGKAVDLSKWVSRSKTTQVELKFVIADTKDFIELKSYYNLLEKKQGNYLPLVQWTLQPEWGNKEIFKNFLDLTRNYIPEIASNVRFIPQMHKFFDLR